MNNQINIQKFINDINSYILDSNLDNKDIVAAEFKTLLNSYTEMIQSEGFFLQIKEVNRRETGPTFLTYLEENPQGLALLLSIHETFIQPFQYITETNNLMKFMGIEDVSLEDEQVYLTQMDEKLQEQKNMFKNIGKDLFPETFRLNDFIQQ